MAKLNASQNAMKKYDPKDEDDDEQDDHDYDNDNHSNKLNPNNDEYDGD